MEVVDLWREWLEQSRVINGQRVERQGDCDIMQTVYRRRCVAIIGRASNSHIRQMSRQSLSVDVIQPR